MQRRHNLTHLILASIVALGLTQLMVCVDAQARIAFVSQTGTDCFRVSEGWES